MTIMTFNTVISNLTVSNGALTTNLSSLSTCTGLSGSSYNGSTGRTFSLDTGYTDNRYYTQSALSNGSVDLDIQDLEARDIATRELSFSGTYDSLRLRTYQIPWQATIEPTIILIAPNIPNQRIIGEFTR